MKKKTLKLVNNADLQVELNTGNTTVVFKGIKDENLGINISQIFQPHSLGKYGYGNGVRLNLTEGVMGQSGEDNIQLLYMDAFGENHYIKDRFYCLDLNGEPYEISRNQLKVNPNGDLIYMTLDGEKNAYRELYSDDGLKAEIPYKEMEGINLFEQRNEEIKKLEEQILSYDNAINDIVQVTLADNTIKYMTKSEALTYESLILQKPYTEEQMDLIRWQIDEMQKTGEKNNAYIKNIRNTVAYSTIKDDEEAIENYISYVAVYENGTIEYEIESESAFNESTFNRLGGKDNYHFTRLQLAQYRSLLSQFNVTLEDENQTVLKKQLANIQGQIDMILNKSDENQHVYESYAKEKATLEEKLKVMKLQAPIYYIFDEDIIKGFNEEGGLCVICKKSSDNYTVIERTKHYSTNVYKITRVCNKDGNGIILHYDDEIGLLRKMVDSSGKETTYEYDSDENLIRVIYPDKQELTFEKGTDYLKVTNDGKYAQITYTENKVSSLEYFTTISEVNHSGTTYLDEPQSLEKIDFECGLNATVTNSAKKLVENYKYDSTGKIEESYVTRNGIYIDAKLYMPLQMGYYTVITANEEALYGETVDVADNSYVENKTFDSFNRIKTESITNKTIHISNGVATRQDLITTYTYNEKNQVVKAVTTEAIHTDEALIKSFTHIALFEYNENGQLLKKQSYTDGEEAAYGINIEEHVYDKNGYELKKITYNSLDPSSKYYEEVEVNEKGQVVAELDQLGKNRTLYEYFANTNTVCSKKYPNGSKYAYGYDYINGNSAITQSTLDGLENSVTKHYTNGLVTKVINDNKVYEFTYDYKERVVSVTIDGNIYAQYLYEYLEETDTEKTTVTYADGSIEIYEFSPNSETKEIIKGENSKKQIKTISNDKVTSILQQENGVNVDIICYTYDDCGKLSTERLYEYLEDGELNEVYSQVYTYTIDGKVEFETINSTTNPRAMYNQYVYDETDNLKSYAYVNDRTTIDLKIDCLGRNKGKVISNFDGNIYSEDISYLKNGDHATNLPVAVQYSKKNGEALVLGDNIRYKYDKMGNITRVYENDELVTEYKYDVLGRLIRENNKELNSTVLYFYDNKGNITSKKLYGFSFKSDRELNEDDTYLKKFNYTYDMCGSLISFDGNEITYDLLGNPTTYKEKMLEWGLGRKLATYGDVTFEYDAFGRRISKTGDSKITYEYNMKNQIFRQSNGVKFFYDNNSSVYAFEYDEAKYYYKKDLLGNVIEILDTNGATVVKYVYDAWGNHKVLNPDGTENTAEDFIGNINPIRYRSYYYDTETGLYYLNARYYDPEVCRFISPDDISYLDPETIGGTNLYAYCGNNPVMRIDPTGHFFLATIVGAIVGAISYAISEVISFALSGEWSWSWGEFFGSVIGGAIGGFVGKALKSLKMVGKLAGAMTTGFSSTAIGMKMQDWMGEENYSDLEIWQNSLKAGAFSALSAKLMYGFFPEKMGALASDILPDEKFFFSTFYNLFKKINSMVANELFYGYWDPIHSGYAEYYEKKGMLDHWLIKLLLF